MKFLVLVTLVQLFYVKVCTIFLLGRGGGEPFVLVSTPSICLLKVRARALMYFNYSGYKLQHHPLEHLSGILMIEVILL